jgi:hypothetical protein
MTLRNSQKTEPAANETFSVSAGRNSRHDGAATMRHDGQPGTERVDGGSPLLHAAAGLVASDRRAGVGSTCTRTAARDGHQSRKTLCRCSSHHGTSCRTRKRWQNSHGSCEVSDGNWSRTCDEDDSRYGRHKSRRHSHRKAARRTQQEHAAGNVCHAWPSGYRSWQAAGRRLHVSGKRYWRLSSATSAHR